MIPTWLLDIIWFVLEKLFGIVRQSAQQEQAKVDVANQAQSDKTQLENATTTQDKLDAARKINDDTFGS